MDQPNNPLYRIADLEKTERPRERLERLGADVLTNAELLAILLRTGLKGESAVQVGQRLLTAFGGLRGLQKAGFQEVLKQKGVGLAKTAQIKAAIELGRRLALETGQERPVINSPEDAAALVKYEMAGLTQENLWVMNLDVRFHLVSIEKLYIGSATMSMVRTAEIFKAAIQRDAVAIIIVHNHPSGDPTPSSDDVMLTRNLVQAGKLLDIQVSDHLIIGQGRYVSMKQLKLGFE
jgi:DNA repair protein RadC